MKTKGSSWPHYGSLEWKAKEFVSIFTDILSICLPSSRIVVVSCLKEITKAATLWMDTSSARPATLPASGCWPPRLALTFKSSHLFSGLVGGSEKDETQEKYKKRNRKREERQSSYGMVSTSSTTNLSLETHRVWDFLKFSPNTHFTFNHVGPWWAFVPKDLHIFARIILHPIHFCIPLTFNPYVCLTFHLVEWLFLVWYLLSHSFSWVSLPTHRCF